jgi:HlyD family secretion protein
MVTSSADLRALSVSRTASDVPLRLPRHWWSRVIFPGALLLGFAGLMVWASWDSLVPPLPVQVRAVIVQSGQVEVAGQELFKANGWIEPRPLPIDVPVQTEAMVRVVRVLVNPGERVKAGQLLVILDDSRAKLDEQGAVQRLQRKQAALRAAGTEVGKAEVAFKNAQVAVTLATTEGEAEVQALHAEVVKAEAEVRAAELAVEQEEQLLRGGVSGAEIKVKRAKLQRDVTLAEVQSAKARVTKAKTAAEVKVRLAETARAAAEADVANWKAKAEEVREEVAEADVEVRKARLECERTRLIAPSDGVVMQLNVREGSMAGGKSTFPEHKDAAVTLYDPKKLQVRVEVPITKFQYVRNGQPAIVEVEDVLPGQKLMGTVLYDTHQANIARNSVPVKVSLPENLPEQLRPDMIASVRFQAPPQAKPAEAKAVQRFLVPRKLLRQEGETHSVWIVNQLTKQAELRPVRLAAGEKDKEGEWVQVTEGLQPSDRLIESPIEQLRSGLRVSITEEVR